MSTEIVIPGKYYRMIYECPLGTQEDFMGKVRTKRLIIVLTEEREKIISELLANRESHIKIDGIGTISKWMILSITPVDSETVLISDILNKQ